MFLIVSLFILANCAVFIYRLPPTWTDSDLYTNFGYYGTIKSVRVMKDASGQPRGFGLFFVFCFLFFVFCFLFFVFCFLFFVFCFFVFFVFCVLSLTPFPPGFVNYESPEAAQIAISAMNGLQVGTYRLSVALKSKAKPGGGGPPY